MPLLIDSFALDSDLTDQLLRELHAARAAAVAAGEIVRPVRRRGGLTQVVVAKALGISVNRLGGIENLKIVPTTEEAVHILDWALTVAPVQEPLPFPHP